MSLKPSKNLSSNIDTRSHDWQTHGWHNCVPDESYSIVAETSTFFNKVLFSWNRGYYLPRTTMIVYVTYSYLCHVLVYTLSNTHMYMCTYNTHIVRVHTTHTMYVYIQHLLTTLSTLQYPCSVDRVEWLLIKPSLMLSWGCPSLNTLYVYYKKNVAFNSPSQFDNNILLL